MLVARFAMLKYLYITCTMFETGGLIMSGLEEKAYNLRASHTKRLQLWHMQTGKTTVTPAKPCNMIRLISFFLLTNLCTHEIN